MCQDRWKVFDMRPDFTLQEFTITQAIKIGRHKVLEDKQLEIGDTPESGQLDGSTGGEPASGSLGPGAWAIPELMRNF